MHRENLPERIVDSVYSPKLSDLGKEFAEMGLDQLLDEGFLKDLPLIGSIVKVFKGVLDIRDRIFIAKIARFLYRLSKIPQENRDRFKNKISQEPKLKQRVGETLILIFDRLDDLEKPDFIAKCFSSYLGGKISFAQFRRLASAVDMAFVDDLKALVVRKAEKGEYSDDHLANLSRTGLVDFKAGGIEGTWEEIGTIKYTVSSLGQLFINIISDFPHNMSSES